MWIVQRRDDQDWIDVVSTDDWNQVEEVAIALGDVPHRVLDGNGEVEYES